MAGMTLVTPEMLKNRIISMNGADIILEPGVNMTASGTTELADLHVKGGATQAELNDLNAKIKPIEDEAKPYGDKLMALYKEYEKNKDEVEKIRLQIREIRKPINGIEEDFIRSHPDSYISLDLVSQRATFIDVDTFEPLYNSLSDRWKNSERGEQMQKALIAARKTKIGNPAIEFAQANANGKLISLKSLQGQYLLVDFWASWCGPCRAENPTLVKAYDAMKSGGKKFEILAVSLDDNKDKWLKAIDEDKLTWLHVSDLKGWKNDVAVEYGVRAIPQNLLLDPNGIIIAKDLRGEALLKKLEELGLTN